MENYRNLTRISGAREVTSILANSPLTSQLSSHYRFDRRGFSAVKFEMKFETRDVVLTCMRSLNSEPTDVANGSIDRNIINPSSYLHFYFD